MDEDEAECRICRGEEEKERKLYSPCLCSGSIKWTHSDCLLQWLEHCRSSKCKLCKYAFQFDNKYSENAPAVLSNKEFVQSVGKVVLFKYLPIAVHVVLVLFSWIGLVPWLTSWWYRLWHFRIDSQPSRLGFWMILDDIRSGVVLMCCIVLSFIALMSFGGFLRDQGDVDDAANRGEVNLPPGLNEHELPGLVDEAPNTFNSDENTTREEPEVSPETILRHAVQDEIENFDEDENPADPVARNRREQNARRNAQFEGQNDGDILELQFAVNEVIGFNAPWTKVLRNITWMLAFNCAYLGIFGFIPSALRRHKPVQIFDVIFGKLSLGAYESSLWAETVALYQNATNEASSRGDCLLAGDVMNSILGYTQLSLVIIALKLIVSLCPSWLRHYRNNTVYWMVFTAIDVLCAFVKVCTLLMLKMIVLPTILGFGMDVASLSIFKETFLDRAAFTFNNFISSFLVHWLIGISFMLFITVSVLQLREVLHPAILGDLVRPQESHPDLLRTLLDETCMAHVRRISVSFTVYGLLLISLIWLPLQIAVKICPLIAPFHGSFSYFVFDIQLPVELVGLHIVCLSVLEWKKNFIGHVQFFCMKFLCENLGITRSLLPVWKPLQRVPCELAISQVIVVHPPPLLLQNPEPHLQLIAEKKAMEMRNNHRASYAEFLIAFKSDKKMATEIKNFGCHIRSRPWPDEDDEEMEFKLEARAYPRLYYAKIAALCLILWAGCVIIVHSSFFIPVYLGRFLHFLFVKVFGSYMWNLHDPTMFALMYFMFVSVEQVFSIFTSLLCRTNAYSSQSFDKFRNVFSWFIMFPFVCGLTVQLLFNFGERVNSSMFDSKYAVLKATLIDWIIGSLLFHLTIYAIGRGVIAKIKKFVHSKLVLAGDRVQGAQNVEENVFETPGRNEEHTLTLEIRSVLRSSLCYSVHHRRKSCYDEIILSEADEVQVVSSGGEYVECINHESLVFNHRLYFERVVWPLWMLLLKICLTPMVITMTALTLIPSWSWIHYSMFVAAFFMMLFGCFADRFLPVARNALDNIKERIRVEKYYVGRVVKNRAVEPSS